MPDHQCNASIGVIPNHRLANVANINIRYFITSTLAILISRDIPLLTVTMAAVLSSIVNLRGDRIPPLPY